MECTEEEGRRGPHWYDYVAEYHIQRDRERERESQYITLWCKCAHG